MRVPIKWEKYRIRLRIAFVSCRHLYFLSDVPLKTASKLEMAVDAAALWSYVEDDPER